MGYDGGNDQEYKRIINQKSCMVKIGSPDVCLPLHTQNFIYVDIFEPALQASKVYIVDKVIS